MSDPQPIFVLRFNHFDPIWRRCWDRDFFDAGRRFVSYRAIEERWIADAIATCADGESCFLVESAWVLRHYLERHPEHVETLRQLTREGRFELLGSGENIVDANLIHGELLVRNLVLGTRWAEETLGVRPRTGWHSDGFGSCAQMPQVFRGCGFTWLPALNYNMPDAPYWRGLDGSTIYFSDDMSTPPSGGKERLAYRLAVHGCHYRKLPPCPTCLGKGCADCRQEGFAVGQRAELAPPKERLPGAVGVLMLWGEEMLPGLHVAESVAAYNVAHPETRMRQGTYRDLEPFIADFLARVDNPPPEQISSKVENNPSESGCYVSRIRIKQGHRALEHALLAAECWDTLLRGGAARDTLRAAWRQMTLSAFHDAVTSSHCDQAYEELLDLHGELARVAADVSAAACAQALKDAPASVTVFNHTQAMASAPVRVEIPAAWAGAVVSADGAPAPVYDVAPGAVTFLATDVPGLGARTFTLAEAPFLTEPVTERTITCGRFTVTAGEHGLAGVNVEGLGAVADTRRFQVGELILEHDIGDPWSTRSLDRTREPLGPYTHLRGVERRGDSVVIVYAGRHPSSDNPHFCDDPEVAHLTWEQRFHLRAGLPWLEVETKVEWYTHSRRLRLAFPSTTKLDRGIYDVPYGTLARDRYEGTKTHGGNAGGDWPALHWAGVQAPGQTFAVFNQGTPSYRVEDGVVLVSVLRSPQIPYGLLDPESYVAHNYQGMTDHGVHHFRHALCVAPGDWRENETPRLAALFNSGLTAHPGALAAPFAVWGVAARHTQLAAVKTAEDGRGLILRLVETVGAAESLRLRPLPPYVRARLCNLMEDDGDEIEAAQGCFSIPIEPWQILTVRLET